MDRDGQYDRQVRLWGDAGQRALEAAHVCLAGATALGAEALKSLALPGVGSVTIVDGGDVAEEDLGVNFLLEPESAGKSRASETLRLLLELNPAVRGHAINESPERLLRERPDFFRDFSAVIACGLTERELVELARNLWEADVPLIVGRSVGFLAALRVQVREHAVAETHPDDAPSDLRLDAPFPGLVDYAESFDLRAATLEERARIPWLVIVYAALRTWRLSRDGAWPSTRAEKEQIREIIRGYGRVDDNGFPVEEENFREAIAAVNAAVVPYSIPKAAREVLYDEACVNLNQKSTAFWIACAAIRGFVEEEGGGALPLSGALPDMTAATDKYVQLQNVYRAKAAADAEAVFKRHKRIAAELGVEAAPEAEVRNFCRHSSTLRVIRGSPVEDEYRRDGPVYPYIARHLEEPDPMMLRYVALRAAERFRAEQCRAPGEWDAESDVPKLKACTSKLLNEWSCPPPAEDDCVREMCRYGGSELHSVSAFMGGCVAQEAIKLITRQYVPVDNFFVYEATTGNSATFKF